MPTMQDLITAIRRFGLKMDRFMMDSAFGILWNQADIITEHSQSGNGKSFLITASFSQRTINCHAR